MGAPERPAVGIAPKLSDAELPTLAVIQALLGFTSEARFIRYAETHLRPWFPYLPERPGYSKRLRHCAPTHPTRHRAARPRIAYALAGAKTDERDTCLDMIAFGDLGRPGQTLIADKGYRRAGFETELNDAGITLIRPALKTEPARPGQRCQRSRNPAVVGVDDQVIPHLGVQVIPQEREGQIPGVTGLA